MTNQRFETLRRLTYQPKQVLGLGHQIITEKTDIQKSMTLVKRIQKPNGYLCIDLNTLSVVEEHCINEEA